ncbi:UNVERIFIED_CONTAM: hypothetical protein PYX00_007014 [Menopon gallinae]|uniref:Protein O-mannosyltransferase 1 n=1 Tax=Menopon gallinae TaxID=328185 RepID=A0AAW2HHD8_9NEOP
MGINMSQENNTGQKKKITNQGAKKSGSKNNSNEKSEGRDNGGDTLKKNVVPSDGIHTKINETKGINGDIKENKFSISFQIDLMATVLFVLGLATRLYRLEEPRSIVFDELHFGKYVGLYMKQIFFFDSHPPLGKQLIAAAAYLAGFDGQFKFESIGKNYPDTVPLFALRCIPALCGSLLLPAVYHLMLELGFTQWTATLAGFLLLMDNALLTQSRFILMEPIMLLFSILGLICALKFKKCKSPFSVKWWLWLILTSVSLTCCLCVKYIGIYSCLLGLSVLIRSYWNLLCNPKNGPRFLSIYFVLKLLTVLVSCASVYLLVFYVHLSQLSKAGPHDTIMTSAFQASLEGGLSSITKMQPLEVSHGSQITLRHTFGRTCWLHSHAHVYPLRYPDKRGSSHQQQVTCYSYKDVNNWWIVKRPNKNDLMVTQPVDAIRHGDIIQLVHGITSRALNSHDVAAPMSPQNQEVSCYIDYNVSMPAQNLWKLDIVNKDQVGEVWHAIHSQVRLIHVNTSQVLKFSGRQLPEWGFNQHEVVCDKIVNQPNSIWNVEEHRYTKSDDQKERERDMVNAEMIPTQATSLTFWEKMMELQYKMLISYQEPLLQSHMYSSEPFEWPLVTRTIAYWVSSTSNAQVHLLGNVVIWWSGTLGFLMYCAMLVFYILRRRRKCFDIPEEEWSRFAEVGHVLAAGYVLHYLPYFFMDRTLFLHHYLPAFVFKTLLLAALYDHVSVIIRSYSNLKAIDVVMKVLVVLWCVWIVWMFKKLSVLSYGTTPLSANDLVQLKLRDTWHFILHKQ